MEDRHVEVLLDQAYRARLAHNWNGAIDLLRRALALDPDHPRAHASLALALLGAQRLHGAHIEAGIALALDGNEPFCHFAAAAVRRAERRLDDAWEHCLVALQADHVDVGYYVLAASIRSLRGEIDEARALLHQALELEPEHVDALTTLARIQLGENELADAARLSDAALAASPENVEAHVIAGYIALRKNDLDAAERHGRFALRQAASDRDALALWTAIKARRSWTLGLWWRWNAFVTLRSETSQVALLIGSFVLVRLAIIIAGAFELDAVERLLSLAWLGFCAYTWIAPGMFHRMLERDLREVTLRPDY
jgi:tetratricopeptide (TPR) repeat protein